MSNVIPPATDATRVAADKLAEAGIAPCYAVVYGTEGVDLDEELHATRAAAEAEAERLFGLDADPAHVRVARVWVFEG